MFINYKFITGEVVEVEVSPEIGAVIVESRHQEELNDRRESRRHYHYDADDIYEGDAYGAEDPDIQALFSSDAQDRVALALSALTAAQKEVITAIYLEGLSAKEYAAKKGISEAAVSKTKRVALEKMKKFLADG